MNRHMILAGLLAATLVAPAAAGAGWLVNVETPWTSIKYGSNVAGGSGDTVDIGVGNHQCSDENDVVDVGVMNTEGDRTCSDGTYNEGCYAERGYDPLGVDGIAKDQGILDTSASKDGDAHCSDDGDTVDIGILNDEGGHSGYYSHDPRESCDLWGEPGYGYEQPSSPDEEHHTAGTDAEDGVDVGIFNTECGDGDDAVDAGVLNCEVWDQDDGADVGVLNHEFAWDGSDTFDLGIFNYEVVDGPDRNGVNIGSGTLGFESCGIPYLQWAQPFPDFHGERIVLLP